MMAEPLEIEVFTRALCPDMAVMRTGQVQGDSCSDGGLGRVYRPAVKQRHRTGVPAFFQMKPRETMCRFRMVYEFKDFHFPAPNSLALELLVHKNSFVMDGIAPVQLSNRCLQN